MRWRVECRERAAGGRDRGGAARALFVKMVCPVDVLGQCGLPPPRTDVKHYTWPFAWKCARFNWTAMLNLRQMTSRFRCLSKCPSVVRHTTTVLFMRLRTCPGSVFPNQQLFVLSVCKRVSNTIVFLATFSQGMELWLTLLVHLGGVRCILFHCKRQSQKTMLMWSLDTNGSRLSLNITLVLHIR